MLAEFESQKERREGVERRVFPRVATRGEAELFAIDGRLSALVHLRDISMGGFGFVYEKPLEVGTHWLAVFLRQNQQSGHQNLVIRDCDKVTDGMFLIGSQICLEDGLIALLGIDRTRL